MDKAFITKRDAAEMDYFVKAVKTNRELEYATYIKTDFCAGADFGYKEGNEKSKLLGTINREQEVVIESLKAIIQRQADAMSMLLRYAPASVQADVKVHCGIRDFEPEP